MKYFSFFFLLGSIQVRFIVISLYRTALWKNEAFLINWSWFLFTELEAVDRTNLVP